jgi:hypothetical protein
MTSLSFFSPSTIILSLVNLCVYSIGLVIYRLFLSPIAHIPGPKLAAITSWVEVYWDLVKGGKFVFKIEEWHEKYGK